jgi:hypothetical protein
MADDEHTHGHRQLKLDDVQMIIGRAVVDEHFREQFTGDPVGTLKTLGISMTVGGERDEKALVLIKTIAEALSEKNRSTNLGDLLENLRKSYLDSADGIIRSRCA